MLICDLNCDMGEGTGHDAEVMPYITSANIACGYHAGNGEMIRETVLLALKFNVNIGAHPSFPDRENFGRTEMKTSAEEVYRLVTEQLDIIGNVTQECGAKLHHVKPHGAMYNLGAKDKRIAKAIAAAVFDFDNGLVLYGLSGSHLITEANQLGLEFLNEVFADRTYLDDGTLTPRSHPNALLVDTNKVVAQVLQMVRNHKVTTLSGKQLPLRSETICIHGDGENAIELAHRLNEVLRKTDSMPMQENTFS